MMKYLLCCLLIWGGLFCQAEEFKAEFKEGMWQRQDWILLKSPRWKPFGDWVQHKDHIQNRVPADATPAELMSKRYAETYTSMLWKRVMKEKKVVVRSRMSFDDRMAPLIVIAGEFGKSADGLHPEHRNHWEVVLYDQGINVWHHTYENGAPSWYLAASLKADFLPRTIYDMTVTVAKAGKGGGHVISVACGGQLLKYREFGLPEEYRVGITGCEGVNRFYDFGVKY